MTSRPWTYVGSANCSESAWGKLVKEKTTTLPKLNCRNWECGVIVPVTRNQPFSTAVSVLDARSLNNYAWRVPIPMQYPSEALESSRPWFYAEQMS